MVRGTVRVWYLDEGWGVVDASNAPGGCFVHFSHIQMDGYHYLRDGQVVDLECEQPPWGDYEGWPFLATRVIPLDEPGPS